MDRYAVIGNPIKHSKSPEIHAQFAAQTSQSLVYERIEGCLDAFEDNVRAFFSSPSNKGLNVTVPFKERAFAMCDDLSPRAKIAEAVNTLYVQAGRLVGDNTDGCGLVTDIQQNYDVSLKGKKVLLLGAGGASKGVLLPVLQAQPSQLVLANRTFSKAEALVGRYSQRPEIRECGCALVARDFASLDSAFDVVINGTSASLSGELPKISPEIFSNATHVYDMMYGNEETVFNRWAKENGAGHTMDGLGMLVEQAAEAFRVWRNIRPDTSACIAALR
ncbi:shikimate dehydrogenase [Oleiphilus sp. HI0071]|uniref:shikimate dehydrogenase n=1 Tax=unclassified Oleiphilus TaxID=2631174 RepID=UPI0007C34E6E|nr:MULTISPECIES: shikimate dehydrogenase [unclassified Oleiphilus]KZY68272.1 shikimate dehydrogenase [Oleiphilus sp. HI0065]KZY82203.1 shikimate dehydrogenase [Oleiphilus sp. HI0071]KZZ06342.1 shikimate dehydrogenase [Oleiphilus sp. HI0073]KZZ42910.1 shikimate dehydrogenase [Oleiphilus sp. HI0118]KZZ53699.1 shikimate dehydrogenase [Oleiphilus sp. HI0122]KZZ71090.1 shikimate dehydrogenase [Oleiphilus sp. HI0130]KZZ78109.1 shikimate dehydrogenase [Oleiphilus sp. HI0133]